MITREPVTPCDGEALDERRLYTVEQVQRACGLGPESLRKARRFRGLPVFHFGRRDYYRGADLIALITSPGASELGDGE